MIRSSLQPTLIIAKAATRQYATQQRERCIVYSQQKVHTSDKSDREVELRAAKAIVLGAQHPAFPLKAISIRRKGVIEGERKSKIKADSQGFLKSSPRKVG